LRGLRRHQHRAGKHARPRSVVRTVGRNVRMHLHDAERGDEVSISVGSWLPVARADLPTFKFELYCDATGADLPGGPSHVQVRTEFSSDLLSMQMRHTHRCRRVLLLTHRPSATRHLEHSYSSGRTDAVRSGENRRSTLKCGFLLARSAQPPQRAARPTRCPLGTPRFGPRCATLRTPRDKPDGRHEAA